MIQKLSPGLVGLITCLLAVVSRAEPSNVVVSMPMRPSPMRLAVTRNTNAARRERIGRLGDPVPPITVVEWIKGKPVKIPRAADNATNFYVLVFCTLSHANDFALTNLSCLQRQYQDKGLVTVAISAEPAESLRQFVMFKGRLHGLHGGGRQSGWWNVREVQHAFGQVQLPRGLRRGPRRPVAVARPSR